MPKSNQRQPGAARADLAALGLRHKSAECEFKAIGEDGSFTVYFGVFGNVDKGGEVLEPNSVRNVAEFIRDGWIAWNHNNASLPIGYPTAVEQDATGILVTGRFHSTPEAQSVRTVAKERLIAGKSVKGSIGYVTIEEEFETRAGRTVRRLKTIHLYECSFVNLPMNPLAEAATVKSLSEGAPPTKGHEPMDLLKKAEAAAAALSDWLTELKSSPGKSMSPSGMTRMKSYAEALHEHGLATREHSKAMNEHGKGACMLAKEMKGFLKAYDPDDDGDDDSTEEGDTDNDRDELPPEKPKKGRKPKDAEEETPPKRDKTAAILAEQLRQRALEGRKHQSCP